MQLKKMYIRDLQNLFSGFVLSKTSFKVAVFSFHADVSMLIRRMLYLKTTNQGNANITILEEPESDDYDFAIVVSDYPYDELPERLKKLKHGIFYTQALADIRLPSEIQLNNTDWLVLRELERKFLSGTDLSLEREQFRKEIDAEVEGRIYL